MDALRPNLCEEKRALRAASCRYKKDMASERRTARERLELDTAKRNKVSRNRKHIAPDSVLADEL